MAITNWTDAGPWPWTVENMTGRPLVPYLQALMKAAEERFNVQYAQWSGGRSLFILSETGAEWKRSDLDNIQSALSSLGGSLKYVNPSDESIYTESSLAAKIGETRISLPWKTYTDKDHVPLRDVANWIRQTALMINELYWLRRDINTFYLYLRKQYHSGNMGSYYATRDENNNIINHNDDALVNAIADTESQSIGTDAWPDTAGKTFEDVWDLTQYEIRGYDAGGGKRRFYVYAWREAYQIKPRTLSNIFLNSSIIATEAKWKIVLVSGSFYHNDEDGTSSKSIDMQDITEANLSVTTYPDPGGGVISAFLPTPSPMPLPPNWPTEDFIGALEEPDPLSRALTQEAAQGWSASSAHVLLKFPFSFLI